MAVKTLTIDITINALSVLANEENLTVTIKESAKGGLIAGTSAAIGGLILGPIGLAVGATIGGVAAAIGANGKFESVGTIINNMEEKDKRKLYKEAVKLFCELSITDLLELQRAITDVETRQRLVNVIVKHVEEQLHMEISH